MGRGRACKPISCAGVLAAACLALAACSASDPFGTNTSRYSKRVIEDGEPIPKGGGIYKVGQPYNLNGRDYHPSENPRYRAEGVASWYGPDFHGRETANGEIYDMHAITAAHTTLPIPSYARVTSLDNGRSIIVRVNDRGPYFGNRVIDLSIGAAKALDFYSKGLARVQVEYVGRAPLEGTDDALLIATLREGSPAPAPSTVRLASAKPLLPAGGGAREIGGAPPLPPERPFSVGSTATTPAAQPAMAKSAFADARSMAKSPERSRPIQSAAASSGEAAPASFAPARGEAAGFMSGRGLY